MAAWRSPLLETLTESQRQSLLFIACSGLDWFAVAEPYLIKQSERITKFHTDHPEYPDLPGSLAFYGEHARTIAHLLRELTDPEDLSDWAPYSADESFYWSLLHDPVVPLRAKGLAASLLFDESLTDLSYAETLDILRTRSQHMDGLFLPHDGEIELYLAINTLDKWQSSHPICKRQHWWMDPAFFSDYLLDIPPTVPWSVRGLELLKAIHAAPIARRDYHRFAPDPVAILTTADQYLRTHQS